jgi:hypothetical protein
MQEETPSRTPLYIILSIAALIMVFGLFAVAMQAGVGMMILLVICAGVLGAIALIVFRGVTQTALAIADKRLQSRAEDYRHVEAVLRLGHAPDTYEPIQRQIAAPVEAQQQIAAPADPRREHALRLITATIESDKYGTIATRLMPQKEAGTVGIIADDWSAGVAYLFAYGVMTGNGGTLIKDGRNVARLMADVARGRENVESGAVMSLKSAN